MVRGGSTFLVDPKDDGITSPTKDGELRKGSTVPFIAAIKIPGANDLAPVAGSVWESIKDLNGVVVTVKLELLLFDAAGGVHALGEVTTQGNVDSKDTG